ncbi:Alpha/beta hydrolase fold-1 [Gloeopeniophorella convolvens]|nr:Alpha/beta hydrolase fold-1 [Gloeopeniophorella convolvens]
MPTLESQSYVFDARPDFPLLVAVKRYWVTGFESTDPDAVTLILAHATSSHKENWEPVLEDLYGKIATANSNDSPRPKIRDAWAIDCPNKGESAALIEGTLQGGSPPVYPWEEFARVINLILNGSGKGIDVDFKSRNLVGVGHSMGALAMTIEPFVNWSSAILVEPMFLNPKYVKGATKFLVGGANKRRDVWSSREEALKAFKERAFKSWDPRIVEVYVKYGLRDLPTLTYPDKTQGVTLSCTKAQEAATYADSTDGRVKAERNAATFCKEVPTHAVFGEIGDVLPPDNREFAHQTAAGRFRSTTLVPNAGHLAVHQNPSGVAEGLWAALMTPAASPAKL